MDSRASLGSHARCSAAWFDASRFDASRFDASRGRLQACLDDNQHDELQQLLTSSAIRHLGHRSHTGSL